MNQQQDNTALVRISTRNIIMACLLCVWFLSAAFNTTASMQVKKPISKTGLLGALRVGGLTTGELVHEVEKRGVDFEMTDAIADELRRAGAKPELITAVGANYRSVNPSPTPVRPLNGPRVSLGLVVQDITPSLALSLGLKETSGVLVNSVEKNYLGEQVGVERRDIIIAINDAAVKNSDGLRQLMARVRTNEAVTLTVLRDGSTRKLTSSLLKNNADDSTNNRATNNAISGRGKLGLRVEPLTPETSARLKLEKVKGLLVTEVDASGPAASAGIRTGDVIEEINGQAVRSMSDVEPALAKSTSGPARLRIHRAGKSFGLELQPRAANSAR
jgi:S1-C subfamily serine protease